MRRFYGVGVLLTVGAALGFSSKSILIKLVYGHGVDAVTMMALRMLLSLPFFLLMAWWVQRDVLQLSLRAGDLWALLGLGLLGYYLASWLDLWGLQYISASLERLLLFLYPTFTVILSALIARRRLQMRELAAIILSYAGILMVFLPGMETAGSQLFLGAGLVLASALAYALYLVGSDGLLQRVGALRFTAYAMTVACLASLLHFVVTHHWADLLGLSPQVYGLSLSVALLSTVLPAWMFAEGMRRIGAGRAALLSAVGPVFVLWGAGLILGESLTAWQMWGAAVTLVGVLLMTVRQ